MRHWELCKLFRSNMVAGNKRKLVYLHTVQKIAKSAFVNRKERKKKLLNVSVSVKDRIIFFLSK